ncbi:MAG: sulfate reduction electron transfer complex DsrMKJOP subunit DsrO [bacterium]
MSIDRRKFIKASGLAALGFVVTSPKKLLASEETPAVDSTAVQQVPATDGKPLVGSRWAMVIDLKKCLQEEGCTDCVDACNIVHNVPKFDNRKDEIKWIWKEKFHNAFEDEGHEYLEEHVLHTQIPILCNHCDNPPCVRVCPTQATWKREKDGIVMMDWHRCIGCRYCVAACPYGSRSFNWRDPRPFIDKINPEFPTRTRGVVEKCTFCEERLAKGKLPSCVEACKAKAILFGDLEDPESEIRKVLAENFTIRRKPGLGTQPEIYYIV